MTNAQTQKITDLGLATGTKSILYLGPDKLTSGHRARALRRLGHSVTILDTRTVQPRNKLINYWNFRSGFRFFEPVLRRRILDRIPAVQFDLVFVGAPDLLGSDLVQELHNRYGTVVSLVIDDPFGGRDGLRWRLFLKSVRSYDLVVVTRECNRKEAIQAGAKKVIRVANGADEVAHRPKELRPDDIAKWSSDVAFIGTWMPERGPFLARLVELGVPISIWGNRWHMAPEWPVLQPFWRAPALDNDEDYPRAIQCAKICLGLLSKGNRDLCTSRSFEIPQLGGVLCAERTPEHESLYKDGEEAVFWSDADECARKCLSLLNDQPLRERIGHNGRLRAIRNRTTNEFMLDKILASADMQRSKG